MIVVYSGTRNLYPYMGAAIRSLRKHNKNAKVYILAEDDDLPIKEPCTVINVAGQTYFPKTSPNINNEFTYMAMMRVCTPELIAEDKVIQLDVDTIVCDSLEPLWQFDLDGKWVAWCEEHQGRWKPYGDKYYNFGVAVLNLKQMRKDNATQTLVNALNSRHYPFIDQDVMNQYAVPDKMAEIPVRYNECFCCGYTDNPAVVHYAGIRDWYENKNTFRWEYLEQYRGELNELQEMAD